MVKKNRTTEDSNPQTSSTNTCDPPLWIEQALVWVDFASLKALDHLDRKECEKGLAMIEEAIERGSEKSSLVALCSAGCQKEYLLWLLHSLSPQPVFPTLDGVFYTPGPRKAEALFKQKSVDFRKHLEQIKKVADKIEWLNLNFEFGYLLPIGGEELRTFWKLPATMRDYAKLMDYVLRHFGHGSEGLHSLAKARLTFYVMHRTGRFHDKEVAGLIGAVRKHDYNESQHRRWRTKHYNRFAKLWQLLGAVPPGLPE